MRWGEILSRGVPVEGSVEDFPADEQEFLEALEDLGCRRAQGFYFARPAPAAEVEARLQA